MYHHVTVLRRAICNDILSLHFRTTFILDSVNTLVINGSTVITNVVRTGSPEYRDYWLSKSTVEEQRTVDLSLTIPPCTTVCIYRPVPKFQLFGDFFKSFEWTEITILENKKIKLMKVADPSLFSKPSDNYTVEPVFDLQDIHDFVNKMSSRIDVQMANKNASQKKEIAEAVKKFEEMKRESLKEKELLIENLRQKVKTAKDQLTITRTELAQANAVQKSATTTPLNMGLIGQRFDHLQSELAQLRQSITSNSALVSKPDLAKADTGPSQRHSPYSLAKESEAVATRLGRLEPNRLSRSGTGRASYHMPQ